MTTEIEKKTTKRQGSYAKGKRNKKLYNFERSFNENGFYDGLSDAQALICLVANRERFSSYTAINLAEIIKNFVVKYIKNRINLNKIDCISIAILDKHLFINKLCPTYHDKIMLISETLINIAEREVSHGDSRQLK